jgi:hypothetical protein
VAEWLRRQTQVLVNFVGVSSILTGCTFFLGIHGGVAQMVERLLCMQKAQGSIPCSSTYFCVQNLIRVNQNKIKK